MIVQYEEILPSPEDVISTGTTGAVEIQSGDAVSCRTEGFELLANPVLARPLSIRHGRRLCASRSRRSVDKWRRRYRSGATGRQKSLPGLRCFWTRSKFMKLSKKARRHRSPLRTDEIDENLHTMLVRDTLSLASLPATGFS